MIPSDIKWDPNATPPQFTDNGDQVIEKGTHLRIKIMGTRSDVGSMFAIGSIKEDFLGLVVCLWSYPLPLTFSQDSVREYVCRLEAGALPYCLEVHQKHSRGCHMMFRSS